MAARGRSEFTNPNRGRGGPALNLPVIPDVDNETPPALFQWAKNMADTCNIWFQQVTDTITNILRRLDTKTSWAGNYVDGTTYNQYDIVLDDGWLMVANKETSEPAAPVPLGEPFDVYQGTMSTTSASAKQIIFGNRYTLGSSGYIYSYRVYVISGNHYTTYTVSDPTGTPVVSELSNFTATTTGWITLSISPRFVLSGSLLDLVSVVNEPDPTPTVTTASYDYLTPQNVTVPLAGQITQARGQSDLIYVSHTDNGTTDRTAFLQGLGIGDIIEGAGQRWSIQSNTNATGYQILGVNPALVGAPIGVQDFNFETVTATPITYAYDTNYWLSSAYTVQGLLGVDTKYSSIIPNDTAYGTDINVQPASVSDDWDFMAYTQSTY